MARDRFDRFTDRAHKVLTYAQEEARRFNHNYIGTEHLLLGLLREAEGVAAQVLRSLGVELNRVRNAVEFIIGRGDRMIVGEVGLTPRAKTVIELAVDEARRLGHHYIGTEHLLLGLVREGKGVAAGVLESLGISLDKARMQTVQVLSQSQADGGTAEQETLSSSESAAQEAQHLLESVPGVLGMLGVPAFRHRRRVHWDYLVAEVEYPQWEDPAAQAEHPRPEAIGLIKRFLGTDEARAGLHGTPVAEALRILGAEGWELAAIDHPVPAGGPGNHYYVFKRMLLGQGSPR
jgi:Clp amino terminal domain, pathogenicity island component